MTAVTAVSTIARLVFADNVESLRRVELRYDPADPYAATLHVDDVTWVFARDLLADGMTYPEGLGDVCVWQEAGQAMVRLSDGIDWVLLHLDVRDVRFFLDLSYGVVARGAEDIDTDLDRWLAGALGGAR